jgi:hypothetical protein
VRYWCISLRVQCLHLSRKPLDLRVGGREQQMLQWLRSSSGCQCVYRSRLYLLHRQGKNQKGKEVVATLSWRWMPSVALSRAVQLMVSVYAVARVDFSTRTSFTETIASWNSRRLVACATCVCKKMCIAWRAVLVGVSNSRHCGCQILSIDRNRRHFFRLGDMNLHTS